MNRRIMIIDDEASIRSSLKEGLSDSGYIIHTAASLKEAEPAIQDFKPQVILLDLRLKDGNGLKFLYKIKAFDDEITVIIMTAYGDIESAVQAMKAGAMEYITKPFDLDEMEVQLERAFKQYQMNRKIHLIEEEREKEKQSIITENDEMLKVLEDVKRLAALNDVTVLITGETGTGKELIADYIFRYSKTKSVPMVKINCAAIPKDLFESELYGHEKNAFTGAGKTKKGLLEMADGGIVFLDEIGEIPLGQQAKLLRFLEEKQVKRVGGNKPIDVQVRVIAATNRDLLEMVQEGGFRADFYYRLNVVPIHLPPLRERKEDIMLLSEYFVSRYNKKFSANVKGFTSEAKTYLENYDWPGNIRELRNLIERICIVHRDGLIDVTDIPSHQRSTPVKKDKFDFIAKLDKGRHIDLPSMIYEIENECIEIAMQHAEGNQSKAADMLNMSRFALKRRLDK